MTINNDIIRLNVGGQHFVTTRTTLCAVEGSLLAEMFCSDSTFEPPREIISSNGGAGNDANNNKSSSRGGEVFLDRNPLAFGYILDYLRDGCRVTVDLSHDEQILQRLRADADSFGLEGLVLYCDIKLNVIKKQDERNNHQELEPIIQKEKLKVYDYECLEVCVPNGPGWKLVKVIPPLFRGNVDMNGEQLMEESFVFERIT